jgi:hypothetical protein
VVLQSAGEEKGYRRSPRADGLTGPDGAVRLSTYRAYDGVPPGEYAVTVEQRKPLFLPDGQRGPNQLPPAYADTKTTPLKATIARDKPNELAFDLTTTTK